MISETAAELVCDTEGFKTRCGRKTSGMTAEGRIVSQTIVNLDVSWGW